MGIGHIVKYIYNKFKLLFLTQKFIKFTFLLVNLISIHLSKIYF